MGQSIEVDELPKETGRISLEPFTLYAALLRSLSLFKVLITGYQPFSGCFSFDFFDFDIENAMLSTN